MAELRDSPTTFISYARADEAFARRLYNDLAAAGVEPWLDRYDIPPGAIWDAEIQRALNACRAVLVVVSAASVASQNVHAEWNYADALGKKLIPLIVERLEPEQIPYRLHGPNWVVFAGADYATALAALIEALPVTAAANPSWDATQLDLSLLTYLELTMAEIAGRSIRNRDVELAAYERLRAHTTRFADFLSNGIIAQHPEEFLSRRM